MGRRAGSARFPNRFTTAFCSALDGADHDALLEVFLRNPGQVLPRNLLLSRVWGMESDVEEGNLDNYIHFLRRRLKSVESTLVLKTIRGIGYQLEVCQ